MGATAACVVEANNDLSDCPQGSGSKEQPQSKCITSDTALWNGATGFFLMVSFLFGLLASYQRVATRRETSRPSKGQVMRDNADLLSLAMGSVLSTTFMMFCASKSQQYECNEKQIEGCDDALSNDYFVPYCIFGVLLLILMCAFGALLCCGPFASDQNRRGEISPEVQQPLIPPSQVVVEPAQPLEPTAAQSTATANSVTGVPSQGSRGRFEVERDASSRRAPAPALAVKAQWVEALQRKWRSRTAECVLQ
ncbi:MAG: hypothetical protein EBX40_01025 [Gammaproteobacteria bacterium]|nr:hypothetical protein [Gammaproteobacteria bacterium]